MSDLRIRVAGIDGVGDAGVVNLPQARVAHGQGPGDDIADFANLHRGVFRYHQIAPHGLDVFGGGFAGFGGGRTAPQVNPQALARDGVTGGGQLEGEGDGFVRIQSVGWGRSCDTEGEGRVRGC